jgi:DNA-binding beta-propeller fold protein YncE
MHRVALAGLFAVAVSLSPAAPVPKPEPRPSGLLVLDNCDETYQGKDEYGDHLTRFGDAGGVTFRLSGLNNCESIGCSRMVAFDAARRHVWVLENVANRIRRFGPEWKETLRIDGVHGSAIAVDPETGNVWALVGPGQIGQGATAVYDPTGRQVGTYFVTGWDIVYDRTARAFWIADKKLSKVTAAKGEVLFSVPVSAWCAASVDVDPRTGAAWVAARKHSDEPGGANRLLKFDPNGKALATVPLGDKVPFRVSADPATGGAWVANLRRSVERYSAEGKSEAEFDAEALAVQVDPAGGGVWVVTPTEVQKRTPAGEVTARAAHAGKTSQAWVTALE